MAVGVGNSNPGFTVPMARIIIHCLNTVQYTLHTSNDVVLPDSTPYPEAQLVKRLPQMREVAFCVHAIRKHL